ncbi:hypothetical protein H4219_000370 [Mycoemilia scoparia]|uniref:WD40 repeat-like protein n=1 Tax=Mycoemilia scoparia TaxID=417184 RepID=A0A9W8A437_9FUNG|nr:hypothetical protein H4219_000370 [Mycoemilia scoparia]
MSPTGNHTLIADKHGNKKGGSEAYLESDRSHKGPVNGLVFSSDGSYIISTGHDQSIRVWDGTTGENKMELYSGGHDNEILVWRPKDREKLLDDQIESRQDQWSDYSDVESAGRPNNRMRKWKRHI